MNRPDHSQGKRFQSQGFEEEIAPPDIPCEGAVKAPRAGDLCPSCHKGRLDYDGLLNLACPTCGAVVNTGGAFT